MIDSIKKWRTAEERKAEEKSVCQELGIHELTETEQWEMWDVASIIEHFHGKKAAQIYRMQEVRDVRSEKCRLKTYHPPTKEEVRKLRENRVRELREAYEVCEPLKKSPWEGLSPLNKKILSFGDFRDREEKNGRRKTQAEKRPEA